MRALVTAALLWAVVLQFGGTASAKDKIWKDEKSGLTWQVTPTGGTMEWFDAKSHCTGLSLNGGGWHLPTIVELRSLIRGCTARTAGPSCNDKEGPADGCYWPAEMQGTCGYYWSSSPHNSDVDTSSPNNHDEAAWYVSFDGGDFTYGEAYAPGHVRCVR
jgi:hypothetical protein